MSAPTKKKSLDEVRVSLAKLYVGSSSGLVAVYNREEITFLVETLTRALEGSSFPGQQRLVNETRELLERWDWSTLPSELEGNLKLYVFNRLRLEKSKYYTFRRLELFILSTQDKESRLSSSDSLEEYAGSQEDSSEVLETKEEDEEAFTYYVVEATDLSNYELAIILIKMGNQSTVQLQVRLYNDLLVVSDDPDLEEYEEASLADYVEDIKKEEGLINKKFLEEQLV